MGNEGVVGWLGSVLVERFERLWLGGHRRGPSTAFVAKCATNSAQDDASVGPMRTDNSEIQGSFTTFRMTCFCDGAGKSHRLSR